MKKMTATQISWNVILPRSMGELQQFFQKARSFLRKWNYFYFVKLVKLLEQLPNANGQMDTQAFPTENWKIEGK